MRGALFNWDDIGDMHGAVAMLNRMDNTGYRSSQKGRMWESFYTMMSYHSIKILTTLALSLVAFGVLVILFKEVFVFIVAGFCFLGALVCLRYAWVIYRHDRWMRRNGPTVDIDENF